MKYFYKDPLAAAWMAKHFGMRFQDNGYEASPYEELLSHYDAGGDGKTFPKYYIHPDSLHLLEPQRGDRLDVVSTLKLDVVNPFIRPTEIVQRNGIAFMWPEIK